MKNSVELQDIDIVNHCLEISEWEIKIQRLTDAYIKAFSSSNYVEKKYIIEAIKDETTYILNKREWN